MSILYCIYCTFYSIQFNLILYNILYLYYILYYIILYILLYYTIHYILLYYSILYYTFYSFLFCSFILYHIIHNILYIQKGTPPGPTNHILAILLIFSYFLFYSCCCQWILLEGYVYMSTFHQRHVSIYISMCFSDATPGGEVEPKKKKIYIYIYTLLHGGRICFLFFSSPPPYTCIYFFFFA